MNNKKISRIYILQFMIFLIILLFIHEHTINSIFVSIQIPAIIFLMYKTNWNKKFNGSTYQISKAEIFIFAFFIYEVIGIYTCSVMNVEIPTPSSYFIKEKGVQFAFILNICGIMFSILMILFITALKTYQEKINIKLTYKLLETEDFNIISYLNYFLSFLEENNYKNLKWTSKLKYIFTYSINKNAPPILLV